MLFGRNLDFWNIVINIDGGRRIILAVLFQVSTQHYNYITEVEDIQEFKSFQSNRDGQDNIFQAFGKLFV